jgi:hypothetical protein
LQINISPSVANQYFKRVKCMEVTEVGSEVDVGMMQTKETNKGGAFKDKFKRSGKTAPTPIQLWTDKYRPLLKSNGWGGAGKKWPKNWGEREEGTLELERILGRSYLTQLVAKKSDVVEGESVTAVTVGESEGCAHMGHMMEDEEVEDNLVVPPDVRPSGGVGLTSDA